MKKLILFSMYVYASLAYSQNIPPVMEATPIPPFSIDSKTVSNNGYNSLNVSRYKTNTSDAKDLNSVRGICYDYFLDLFKNQTSINIVGVQDEATLPVVSYEVSDLFKSSFVKLFRLNTLTEGFKTYINYNVESKNGKILSKTFECNVLKKQDGSLFIYESNLGN